MAADRQPHMTAIDLAYIKRHWIVLAAEAWWGYVAYGRGAILIDYGNADTPLVSYRTRLSDTRASGWHSPAIEQQVRQYDPSREVVFLVVRDAEEVQTYRLEAVTLPPPQAYEWLRRSLWAATA